MKVKQRETKLPLDIPILIFENSTHWENKFKWILVVFFVIREYIGAFSLRSRLHFIKNQPHRITKCNVKDASFKILRLATEYPDCENYFGSLILWIINTWGYFDLRWSSRHRYPWHAILSDNKGQLELLLCEWGRSASAVNSDGSSIRTRITFLDHYCRWIFSAQFRSSRIFLVTNFSQFVQWPPSQQAD